MPPVAHKLDTVTAQRVLAGEVGVPVPGIGDVTGMALEEIPEGHRLKLERVVAVDYRNPDGGIVGTLRHFEPRNLQKVVAWALGHEAPRSTVTFSTYNPTAPHTNVE